MCVSCYVLRADKDTSLECTNQGALAEAVGLRLEDLPMDPPEWEGGRGATVCLCPVDIPALARKLNWRFELPEWDSITTHFDGWLLREISKQ